MSSEKKTETGKPIFSLQHMLDLCTFSPLAVLNFRDRHIRGISLDSRTCRPGYVYFAIPGVQHDGHDFMDEAVRNGAETVFYTHNHPRVGRGGSVCYIRTADIRKSLSEFSAVHYGQPSSDMLVIGVTGTDGKTTTAYFLFQLLNRIGIRTGLISGVWSGLPETLLPAAGLTTPESHEIHKLLHQFRENQCRAAVIEVSSHALSEQQKRVDHVAFDGFIFTPITRDHFDYHGTYAGYLAAKLRAAEITSAHFHVKNQRMYCSSAFLQKHGNKPFCVCSASNPAAEEVFRKTRKWTRITAVCSLSSNEQKHVQAPEDPPDAEDSPDAGDTADAGESFSVRVKADCSLSAGKVPKTDRLNICWDGWNGRRTGSIPAEYFSSYQIEDLASALGALHQAADMTGSTVPSEYPDRLEKVPGRHTVLELSPDRSIIIDYAHTPAAITSLLSEYRSAFPRYMLIAVTGAAGNRDSGKRPMMAAAAEAYADAVIFTTEDPCREKQIRIFSDLRRGISGRLRPGRDIFFIRDRRTAISFGISRMENSPSPAVLLLLGKGHETSICTAGGPLPWDELEETLRIVESLGKSRYDISIY